MIYDISLKEPTCFKNPENPSCINLILTNKPRSFIKTGVIEIRVPKVPFPFFNKLKYEIRKF